MLALVSGLEAAVPFSHQVVDAQAPFMTHTKAAADVNGDGFIDLLVGSGQQGDGLYWYEYPNWARHTIVPPGVVGFTTDMQMADVDRDGDMDIVIPKGFYFGATVWWYENPRPAGNPAVDSWPEHLIGDAGVDRAHDVEVGDVNNDGKIDVVVRLRTTTLFLQNTPTSWTKVVLHDAVQNGEGLDLGDVDGDGDQDVVINGSWLENPLPGGNPAVATWLVRSVAPWSLDGKVETGDLNHDGRLDIVMGRSESSGGVLAWFEATNPRTGPWTQHIIDATADHNHSLQLADLDADGHLDVVVAEMHQSSDPDEVRVFLNVNGTGLSWTEQLISNKGSHNFRVIDVDRDGDLDIFGANWDGSTGVDLWRNRLDPMGSSLGSWQRHLIDGAMPWQPLFITVGDVDGDRRVDIISGGWWYRNPGSIRGQWVRNTIGANLNNMAWVEDFDGDGDLDVFGTDGTPYGGGISWARNNGSGNFTIFGNVAFGQNTFFQGAVGGVFTPGGPYQVAMQWQGGEDGASPVEAFTVPANPTSGPWTKSILHGTSVGEALSKGDIDGDGDLDLFQGSAWLRNEGSGNWTRFPIATFPANKGGPDRNHLVDIDQDGDLDAVVGFSHFTGPDTYLLWLEHPANPTQPWPQHVVVDRVWGGYSLDVADIDFDGDIDILLGEHRGGTRALIYENINRGAAWLQHVVDPGGPGIDHHDGTKLVDLDQDGDLDFVSIGWDNDKLWIFENTASVVSQLPRLVACYGFEEGAGSVVTDASGNGYAGALQGGAARSPAGYRGAAIQFNGVDSRVNLGALDPFGAAITLALWFKADDFDTADARLISQAQTVTDQDHYFMLSTISTGSGMGLRFRIKTTSGGTTTLVGGGSPLLAGEWVHVAATYDGARMRLYQNGLEIGSAAKIGPMVSGAGVQTWIGANPDGARFFDGTIDEVKIFSVALSPTEIHELMESGAGTDSQAPTVPTGLVATPSSASEIRLTWTPASDNVGVTGYQIYRDGVRLAGSASATYLDIGLAPGSTRQYQVSALDAAGNESGLSGSVPVTTHGIITISVVAGGTVALSPNLSSYPFGSVVSLSASPQAGWIFNGWSGAANGSATPTSLTVFGTHAVTATFVPDDSPISPGLQVQPASLIVIEPHAAVFSVVATGSVPLTYQWRRDGIPIPGATASSYSLNTVSQASDDGAQFDVVVGNEVGSVTSSVATLLVVVPGTRVQENLMVLYPFNEGSGTTVHDVSGVGTPLDLTILDPTKTQWLEEGGLQIVSSGSAVRSPGTAEKIHAALAASGQLTLEVWVTPGSLSQSGPARIVALSGGTALSQMNLHLGQGGVGGGGGMVGDFRLRTSEASFSWLQAEQVFTTTAAPRHVVGTYDGVSQRVYVDGVELDQTQLTGDLSNWDLTYPLVLGNEATLDRSWLGSLHLVALFDRALSVAEVQQNYAAGPAPGVGVEPPEITGQPSDVTVNQPAPATFGVTVTEPVTYQWRRDGVPIAGANGGTYTLSPTSRELDHGAQFDLVLANQAGSVTSRVATLTVNALTLLCSADKTVECGTVWLFDQPVARDACGSVDVAVPATVTNVPGPGCYSVTRTWQAADSCGNVASCGQTVTVVDQTPPELVCANDKRVTCGTPWDFDPPTTSDSCGSVLLSVEATVTNTIDACVVARRTWRVTDLCANFRLCSQTVTEMSPPQLSVEFAETFVRLSWSAEPGGYVLEESHSFTEGSWAVSSAVPVLEQGRLVITRVTQSRGRFFRLRRLTPITP